jgi:hypothetical protein
VLNRPITKSYALSLATPVASFCYDGQVYSGTGCVAGTASQEAGLLTGVGNANSSTEYRHQALGLVRWSQQITNGVPYTFEADHSSHADGYVYL